MSTGDVFQAQPGKEAKPHQVELYLPSILGYEKIARSAAEAIAEEMAFSPDRIEDLKTAVCEACMNAIEHGNQQDQATIVAVLISAGASQLEVRVTDEGRQTLPQVLPEPGQGDMRGWGLFFIYNLVDELEFNQLPDGGNEVRMVIYLTPPGAVSGSSSARA